MFFATLKNFSFSFSVLALLTLKRAEKHLYYYRESTTHLSSSRKFYNIAQKAREEKRNIKWNPRQATISAYSNKEAIHRQLRPGQRSKQIKTLDVRDTSHRNNFSKFHCADNEKYQRKQKRCILLKIYANKRLKFQTDFLTNGVV